MKDIDNMKHAFLVNRVVDIDPRALQIIGLCVELENISFNIWHYFSLVRII